MDDQTGQTGDQYTDAGHAVGPEIDDTSNPTEVAPEDASRSRGAAGREMLVQLQQMIDTLATQAGPVMREVAAKAAELAAVAGEKAGPIAHKAAGVTETLGQRMAAKSKDLAAEWRRPADATTEGDLDETPPSPDSGVDPAVDEWRSDDPKSSDWSA